MTIRQSLFLTITAVELLLAANLSGQTSETANNSEGSYRNTGGQTSDRVESRPGWDRDEIDNAIGIDRGNDPTVPSEHFQKTLQNSPSAGPPVIPTMELKGRIIGADNEAEAVISIDNKLHHVQEQDHLTIQASGSRVVIEIMELTIEHVVVNVKNDNQIVKLK